MDPITTATHEWAAEQIGMNASAVQNVYFDTEDVGGCETCGIGPEAIATVVLVGHGGTQTIDLDGMDVVDVIREITARVKPEPSEPSWGRP